MDEFEAGRNDAITGEVRHEWSDMWSEQYRLGVIDGSATIGLC